MGDMSAFSFGLYLLLFVVVFGAFAAFKARKMWSQELFITIFLRTLAIYPLVLLILVVTYVLERYTEIRLSFVWQLVIILVLLFIGGAISESYFSKRVKMFEKGTMVMLVSSTQVDFDLRQVEKIEQDGQRIHVTTTSASGLSSIKSIRIADDAMRKEYVKRIKTRLREVNYAKKHGMEE